MGIRYRLQKQVLEPLQFRVDRLGPQPYQPLPWDEGRTAKRDRATRERWDAIERFLSESQLKPESALDLGCNIGFFSFSLAKAGIPTLGVEMDPRYFRIASYAAARMNDRPVTFLNLAVDYRTIRLVPTVDLTVLLAVWHHWVRNDGLDGASALLREVWRHTNRALIFESGEN